jgi:hypothetical protein
LVGYGKKIVIIRFSLPAFKQFYFTGNIIFTSNIFIVRWKGNFYGRAPIFTGEIFIAGNKLFACFFCSSI